MRFASPWLLLLLILVPPVIAWSRRAERRTSVRYPSLDVLKAVAPAGAGRRRVILWWLRAVALMLVVAALARPQAGRAVTKVHREGVDVVIALDVSGSMLAEDFTLHGERVNRLEAVKAVATDFIRARPDDRIGLVLLAARAYTQCPLTLDHGWLIQNLERARVGMIEDGTAIGAGLATAVNRLRPSTAKSKFVILLTDGESNAGTITPRTAAEAAAALAIKVYTIGVGSEGMAPYPMRDMLGRTVYRPMQVTIDEQALTEIADVTHGAYFRATDTDRLRAIYEEIDASERTDFEAPDVVDYRELYPWLVWPALALVLLELGLAETVLRKLP